MKRRVASMSSPGCPSEEDAIPGISYILTDADGKKYSLGKTSDIALIDVNLTDEELARLTLEAIQAEAERQIPVEVRDNGDVTVGAPADLDIAVPYYYRTCPYKWYVLWQYKWYWQIEYTNSIGNYVVERWFTPWWVWGTYCGQGYCQWSYWPYSWFDARYRCFTEYRLIRLPVICYRKETNQDGTVVSEWNTWNWRYVWVPRGCCCRKYWWFQITASTCPAPPIP